MLLFFSIELTHFKLDVLRLISLRTFSTAPKKYPDNKAKCTKCGFCRCLYIYIFREYIKYGNYQTSNYASINLFQDTTYTFI